MRGRTVIRGVPLGARSEAELAAAIARRFPEAYLTAEQMHSALRVLDYSYFTATNRSAVRRNAVDRTRRRGAPVCGLSAERSAAMLSG